MELDYQAQASRSPSKSINIGDVYKDIFDSSNIKTYTVNLSKSCYFIFACNSPIGEYTGEATMFGSRDKLNVNISESYIITIKDADGKEQKSISTIGNTEIF